MDRLSRSRFSSWQFVLLLGSLCLAFTAGCLWGRHQGFTAQRNHEKVFVLAVWVNFEETSHREKWVSLWKQLAVYVKKNEPGTLSYELSIADTDPNKVLVFERYTNRMELTEVHMKSGPYRKFKKQRRRLPFNYTVQGQSYYESNLGYM